MKLNHQHVSVSRGALLIAALIASGSVLCYGAVVTPGLSGPFAGWSAVGDVATTDGSFNGGVPPPSGPVAVASTMINADSGGLGTISGVDAVSPAALATALGTGALAGTGQASGFSQTFTLGGPGTVNFQWNFFTGEPSTGADYAFYTLHQQGSAGSIVTLATSASSLQGASTLPYGMDRQSGYQSSGTIPIPSAGTWVLGFGVVDDGILSGTDSAVAITSVSVVPEPWAWSLISALALGGVAVVRRMRVSRA